MQGKIHYIHKIEEYKKVMALKDENNLTLIICFCAKWCGPCTALTTFLEANYAPCNPSVIFIKIDVDECNDLANEWNVSGLPTVIIMDPNKPIQTIVGFNRSVLESSFEKINLKKIEMKTQK